MSSYADIGDIRARLPNRTIDATSKPTQAQVEAWIAEAESEIDGEISAAGFTVPVSAARGISICTAKVASKVAGRVERAYVSGTDLEGSEQGDDLLEEFDTFLAYIRAEPARAGLVLGFASASGGSSAARSYWTDNSDGLSATAGDFDPAFTRDMKT